MLGASRYGQAARPPSGRRRRTGLAPSTSLGRWAVGLAAAAVALVLVGGARIGFAAAVAGGIAAVAAVSRRGERAVTVFVALLPLLGVVAFVVAELVGGHE